MYTNPDGQFTPIIRYILFSIYKISELRNDISITISVNENVLHIHQGHFYYIYFNLYQHSSIHEYNIGQLSETENRFHTTKSENGNCTILNFFDFRNYPYKPLCTLCLEQF